MQQEILTKEVFKKYYTKVLLNSVFKEEVCKKEYADSLIRYYLYEDESDKNFKATMKIININPRINFFLLKDILINMICDACAIKGREIKQLLNLE